MTPLICKISHHRDKVSLEFVENDIIWRPSGLMVSMFDSGLSVHKTLTSHSAKWTQVANGYHPLGSKNTPSCFMLQKLDKLWPEEPLGSPAYMFLPTYLLHELVVCCRFTYACFSRPLQ